MSDTCLHCRIHDLIQAHARETYRPRPDGRQPIDAPMVLKDLGAVVAEIVAGGEDEATVSAALGAFMASMLFWLNKRGVSATMTVGATPDATDGVRLQ